MHAFSGARSSSHVWSPRHSSRAVHSKLRMMTMDPDRVARACIDEYTRHPEFGPVVRSNGVPQFTVLAGIVLYDQQSEQVECVSLGTGSKCLPATKLPKSGEALHDSHAEVLARRAALAWFYRQLEGESEWVVDRKLREGVEVWMYISTLPCVFVLRFG
ncbi:hypothetical protein ACGC1H_001594 [Rhizoctonia solani]